MRRRVRFRVNGRRVVVEADPQRTLLWVLRGDLGLTGTKYGCGAGICGSCTVVVGRRAVRSCQASLKEVEGRNVMTVEGLERGGALHALQQAFIEHGAFQCGYCTVVVGRRAVRSCQTSLKEVEGRNVLTVEGLERGGALHPLQQAFIEHGAFQCGYCTPGMLMSAYALLLAEPSPSPDAIAKGMEDNLCRCGAYQRILAAVQAASREGARR